MDVIGRVIRTCLQVGVTPVFAPPREPGFQAAIESYNGRWQSKVWARFIHGDLADLTTRSDRNVAAARIRASLRGTRTPPRNPLPLGLTIDLQTRPRGVVIFLRRTDHGGHVSLLGRRFLVTPDWAHRLTRAEVDFDAECIRFFGLRRRQPQIQPLLRVCDYMFPNRRFRLTLK